MTQTLTREVWLRNAVEALRPMFVAQGVSVPERVHVSVGFPSKRASSTRNKTVGQCWRGSCSSDGAPHIFLHPELHEGSRVLDVLMHELTHAALPDAGHNKLFAKTVRALGLVGKPTATIAGPELIERLNVLVRELGEYPHPVFVIGAETKKQTTRLLKIVCSSCGYTARTTQRWLDVGVPTCVCGGVFGC